MGLWKKKKCIEVIRQYHYLVFLITAFLLSLIVTAVSDFELEKLLQYRI